MKRVVENQAKYLLAYMQGDASYRAKHKVSQISQNRIRELLALMMKAADENHRVFQATDELRTLAREISKRLAKYPSILEVKPDGEVKSHGVLRFSERITTREGLVARYIFHLAEEDLLYNIRDCMCGKLFYATRSDQKSCTSACRHKRYEQTEEFKQKRRDQARENYRLHKQGKVRERNG
jgi:hypothetical protein